jgi:hypothetical protein
MSSLHLSPPPPRAEEKARTDALVQRMSALISCLDPSGAKRAEAASTASAGGVAAASFDLTEAASLTAGGLPALPELGSRPQRESSDADDLSQGGASGPLVDPLSPGGPERTVSGRSSSSSYVDKIEAVRRELSKASVVVGADNITCCQLLVRRSGEQAGLGLGAVGQQAGVPGGRAVASAADLVRPHRRPNPAPNPHPRMCRARARLGASTRAFGAAARSRSRPSCCPPP